MEIRIIPGQNKPFILEVEPSMTILDLKKLISERLGGGMDYMHLSYKCRILDESKTLSEYEVGNHSTIFVVCRTRGDIGVFDSHHLESIGREWLMQTKSEASKEEVNAIIQGLGASISGQVQVFNPVKGLKCE